LLNVRASHIAQRDGLIREPGGADALAKARAHLDRRVMGPHDRSEVVRQVAPWRPGSQDPEDAIEGRGGRSLVARRAAYWAARLDGSPFVGEFAAHDSGPFGQGLESRLGSQAQRAPTDGNLVAMHPKADSPGRMVWTERLALDGRKKNDNQGSTGVVSNVDVPASPVLLLSIATHAIPY
jgi:hypothetical protein